MKRSHAPKAKVTRAPDLGQYVFGGYLVTQRVARPAAMSADLLPAQLLTASACIASFVPDVWALEWANVMDEERSNSAGALGISPESLPGLISYVTAGFGDGQFGWPNIVNSREALAGLWALLPRSRPWVVLGLGLHRKYCKEFLRSTEPEEGTGAGGIYELIAAQTPLPPGGAVLGYEPLCFDRGVSPHSWLCNGLETKCFEALRIRPNQAGLIGAEDDADRVVAHVSLGRVGAEPGTWLPVMLVEYSSVDRRAAQGEA